MNLRSLGMAGLGLATAISMAVAPAHAAPDNTTYDAPSTSASKAASATDALDAVEAIFAPTPKGARSRALASGARPDATMALRDLWLALDDLSPTDRAAAERYLARPAGGPQTPADPRSIVGTLVSPPVCQGSICVRHTTLNPTTGDGATAANVTKTMAVLQEVHGKYLSAGFQPPRADLGAGGTAQLDVYLMNLRSSGIYGYCANDADGPRDRFATAVYCVLDNDYVGYPTAPDDALKVTVAHEYFHAVQAAYDWAEDTWLMEGSAAWVEDEIYPDINDNRQYLFGSQLVYPNQPLDFFNDTTQDGRISRYGSWIFLRYLSERWAAKGGQPLALMKMFWERADSRTGKPDDHSTMAINNVLKSSAVKKVFPGGFARTYNSFAAANRLPKKYYSEGKYYPTAKAPTFKFKKRSKSVGTKKKIDRLPHLSSYTARLVPHKSFKSKKTKLKFTFDLPSRAANPGVTVRTFTKKGKVKTTAWVKLNKKGNATKAFGFSAKKVKYLEVTVSNGSIASTCWKQTPLACQGIPKHDWLRHKLSAKLVR